MPEKPASRLPWCLFVCSVVCVRGWGWGDGGEGGGGMRVCICGSLYVCGSVRTCVTETELKVNQEYIYIYGGLLLLLNLA